MDNAPSPVDLGPLLLALFEESSDAIFVKDVNGKYLLFNRARRPGLFDLASAQRVMARDQRVLRTGLTETEEEVLTAASITRVWRKWIQHGSTTCKSLLPSPNSRKKFANS